MMQHAGEPRGPRDAARGRKLEAPPLGQQRRGQRLNDQHQPDKGPDMDNQPSIPSVTEALPVDEDHAVCRISFNIPRPLVSFNGVVYTVTMTVADASGLGRFLLDMAADAERTADTVAEIEASQMSVLERALEMQAAGISVIPMDADGKPAVENWEEFQHRRATPDEIRAWFGPESTHGAP